MPLSKVKHKKQESRLNARRDGWEKIPASEKFSSKSNRPIYTKPGSNKK